MKNLSPRQMDAFEFICEFWKKEGCPPTIKELGNKLGIKESSAYSHIKSLCRKGYIQKSRLARSIRLKKQDQEAIWILRTDLKGYVLERSRTGETRIICRFKSPSSVKMFLDAFASAQFVQIEHTVAEHLSELGIDSSNGEQE